MPAEVAGTRKRGVASFLDDPFEVLQRGLSPSAAVTVADLGISKEFDSVEALQSVFPEADPQVPLPEAAEPTTPGTGFEVAFKL
ncbi:hypothetical protein ZWY2020_040895 [Hordeum vulgare]|nr:hypothetical protein ZWY2020_040895 [Hordeum vulgare]